jgi:hypothetical protein
MFFAGYYLWIAPHVLLGIFLIFLLRRKLQRELPIFTTYVVFELIQFLVLFTLSLHSPFPNAIYKWTLVVGAGIGSILGLGVIYELASELLLSRSPLKPVLRPILQLILAVLLLGAAGASGAFSGISVQRATNTFQTIDFSSNLIEAGMVLALFVFARVLRVSWHSWSAGVVLGFGVAASIDLVTAALRAAWGKRAFVAADITQMAAFHVCVVIWLFSLFLARRPAAHFADAKLTVSDLELWDQELQRMVQR